jgi:hypothetical protein
MKKASPGGLAFLMVGCEWLEHSTYGLRVDPPGPSGHLPGLSTPCFIGSFSELARSAPQSDAGLRTLQCYHLR